MAGAPNGGGEKPHWLQENILRVHDPKKGVIVLGCHKPRLINQRASSILIGHPPSLDSDLEDSFDDPGGWPGGRALVWKPYPSSPVFPLLGSRGRFPPPLSFAQSSSSSSSCFSPPPPTVPSIRDLNPSKEPKKKVRKELTGCAIFLLARRVGRWFKKVVRRAAAKVRNKCEWLFLRIESIDYGETCGRLKRFLPPKSCFSKTKTISLLVSIWTEWILSLGKVLVVHCFLFLCPPGLIHCLGAALHVDIVGKGRRGGCC